MHKGSPASIGPIPDYTGPVNESEIEEIIPQQTAPGQLIPLPSDLKKTEPPAGTAPPPAAVPLPPETSASTLFDVPPPRIPSSRVGTGIFDTTE